MRSRGIWLPCFLFLSGCASISHRVDPPAAFSSGEGCYLERLPAIAQRAYQCGPAALESVLRYWAQPADAQELRRALITPGARGVMNFVLANYPRTQGLWTEVHQASREDLRAWLRRGIPPIVMLRVGPLGIPTYHFMVVRGFSDPDGIYYANVGEAVPHAIHYAAFDRRWKDAGHWCLIVVPGERVDWELSAAEAGELAQLVERAGQLQLAERWYRAALVSDPENQAFQFNLANVYLRLHNWQAATLIYRDLLEASPQWGAVSNNLAWIAVEEGKPQEAVQLIEQAFLRGAAREYDILDTLGWAYCRLQQSQAAQEYFMEALEQLPVQKTEAREMIEQHAAQCASDDGSVM